MLRCDGGAYGALAGAARGVGAGELWMKHGIESLRSLARWVAATAARDETAGVIDSLEVANEPGLNTRGLQAVILAFTREAVLVARGELPRASGVKLVLNFIQPNDEQVASWLGLGLGLGLLTLTLTLTLTSGSAGSTWYARLSRIVASAGGGRCGAAAYAASWTGLGSGVGLGRGTGAG